MKIYEFYKNNKIDPEFDENLYASLHPETKNFYQPFCRINNISDKHRLFFHYAMYGGSYSPYKKSILDKTEKVYQEDSIYKSNNKYRIAISVLLFYPDDQSVNFIKNTCGAICRHLFKMGFSDIDLHVRNNTKNHNTIKVKTACSELSSENKFISVHFHESHNVGYGEGHNQNFALSDSDIFLCLNDDLEINEFNWLNEVIFLFDSDPMLGIVGCADSPNSINDFGCGHKFKVDINHTPDYSEGSIFFIRSDLFKSLSGFDKIYKYFYFEDVDICLRSKQLGYEVKNINIPHDHKRGKSANKIPTKVVSSIIELNRARFLCRWKKYLSLNNKKFTNRILINVHTDGVGDILDAYFPVANCIEQHKLNNIDIAMPHEKVHCLYKSFENVSLIKDFDINDYDIIYNIDKLNFSYPMHTLDLIASKLNVIELNTDPTNVKKFVNEKLDANCQEIKDKYVVLHLDSQRSSFEGRMPEQSKFIPLLNFLQRNNYTMVLIGQTFEPQNPSYCYEYENKISQLKKLNKLIDHRNFGTIENMIKIINDAFMFIGIDSGPSHMAQLLDIPSYIIYGPINPITKIYRYHNSATFYNLDTNSGSGDYHLNLDPSYHFDIRRDFELINIDPKKFAASVDQFIKSKFKFDWSPIFDNLRHYHRNILNLQYHNPVYYNPILQDSGTTVKGRSDFLISHLLSYEKYAASMIRNII